MPSLKQELSACNYSNKRRVEDDVNDALRKYTQLRTSKAQELGTNKRTTVLYLIGTIPVTIQGSVYNIPISICVPSTYPYTKPDASVKPTDNMSIAPSHPNVDSYGRIILNYLSTWNPSSSLVGAIDAMVSAFSLCSPLYAKPKTPAPQAQQPPPSAYPPPQQAPYGAYSPYQQQPYGQPPLQPQQAPYGAYSPYQQQPYGQPQQPQQQPPPRPPKPSGAREREIICERLRARSGAILSETSAMESELKSVECESSRAAADRGAAEERLRELDREAAEVREENERMERWIGENEGKGALTPQDVDEATKAVDALERQRLGALAEDAAIDDVIYALDKGIKDGVISLDEYLRLIRKYSAEQYYAKALANKVNAALYHY